MPAPQRILELVKNFDRNLDAYRSGGYNETQVRREFIDPLFKCLGWDIDNEQGHAEAYKDVIHEDAIKIGGATKAPDYCFRIGGTRKFFLEAKKPSIYIKGDPAPAYQLRRYAWSAKLPLSVLTDFEEFAVYDCRILPAVKDKADKARITYYTFRDYEKQWDDIAGVFSREAVLKGSFDKYADTAKGKRGTSTVDAAFLEQLGEWRVLLARNLALRNAKLTEPELNYAVQMTLDRIIFLRMCEDRGIEPQDRLHGLCDDDDIYKELQKLFRAADDRYNSGLFYFEKERERGDDLDTLTPNLKIDDKPLKEIIKGLYYPECPYEFSVLPADILGQVYEQFLGQVIRLTSGHQAKVEDKPEVKKAGGVYYTPTYIVDYIVKNTVGKLLGADSSSPVAPQPDSGRGATGLLNTKSAAKLRILDPACGSGSFLLGAYQFLLDWHRDWYVADGPEKHRKELYEARGGWHLTNAERKRILLNNIYGVDIDPQAVEVTKLSLLLKVLEGESSEAIDSRSRMFHERALPDLAGNIKCGNSLIGPDFYDHQQMSMFDDDERRRINVFDWNVAFPEIMKAGGFDAVIGNPPYGFHQIHSEWTKPYLKSHYVASEGSFEHYFLFYERSLELLRSDGFHGYIVPVTWLTIPSAASLRRFVLGKYAIRSIAWLPELVFRNAQVNTLVSIIARSEPDQTQILISEVNDPSLNRGVLRSTEQQNFVTAGNIIHIFEDSKDGKILEKIELASVPLKSLARPCSGYNPYEVGKGQDTNGKPHTSETVSRRPYHSSSAIDKAWKPELVGRDLGRYSLNWPTNRFIKYGDWLAAPRDPENYRGARLLVQEITGGSARRIIAAYCDSELYYSRDVIPVKCDAAWPSPLFLLAIVNSWVMTWRHHRRSPKAKKALFPKVLVSDLGAIPVPEIAQSNAKDTKRHDRIVALVEQMLSLHPKLAAAKSPHERTSLEAQIAATDRQIDRLVYELYGLTDDEIAIVEEATGG